MIEYIRRFDFKYLLLFLDIFVVNFAFDMFAQKEEGNSN